MAMETGLAHAGIEQGLKQFLLVLSVSLGVATLPQVSSWFRRIPYTLLLVIVGLALATVDVRLVNLSPELILFIFLPPLLFEAAWNIKWADLKSDLKSICLYAVIGVVISIVGVAVGLNYFVGMPLEIALLIGASLSATDPVSVIALFRELGVDKRLSTLMEGESLFNDGMAVVAFSFLVVIPLSTTPVDLSFKSIAVQLLIVVSVGVGIGSLLGFGISYLTQRFDLPLVEQSLTLVSAYGSYLLAEEFGGSGVIAVVCTGLILGNFGSRIGMNPRTRVIVSEFWEFLAFFVNSIVFLLIGDQMEFDALGENLIIIGVTIACMVVSRAIAIYVLSLFSNSVKMSEPISWPKQIILWWGGLRGSVSIALALSVPAILPQREEIIAAVFGVVLFTLLAQGLTIQPILQKLKLLGNQPARQEYMELVARQDALNRVLERLAQVGDRPGIDPEFVRLQETLVNSELKRIDDETETLINQYPDLRDFTAEQLKSELLAVEADSYADYVKSGRLNKELAPLLDVLIAED
ncbi:MAG: Na+/H+ antiporter [Synechococcales cyanobacterium T60_A2020_003]|nr:Na+/H+ antiporter [Synechococcales cyanobacterium T60_A2020_003]